MSTALVALVALVAFVVGVLVGVVVTLVLKHGERHLVAELEEGYGLRRQSEPGS